MTRHGGVPPRPSCSMEKNDDMISERPPSARPTPSAHRSARRPDQLAKFFCSSVQATRDGRPLSFLFRSRSLSLSVPLSDNRSLHPNVGGHIGPPILVPLGVLGVQCPHHKASEQLERCRRRGWRLIACGGHDESGRRTGRRVIRRTGQGYCTPCFAWDGRRTFL